MRLAVVSFLFSFLGQHHSIDHAMAIQQPEDICSRSEKAAGAANRLAQTKNYDSAVAFIKKAQLTHYKEYVIAFGKDSAGNIIHSSVSSGNINNGYIPLIGNRIADIHIHTNEYPPSSGDLYGFIDQVAADSSYIRYIITPMGQAYALVLINNKDALHFNIAYPRRPGIKQSHADGTYINYQPTFPQELVDEINRLRSWNGATPEMAFIFLLKKYNTGIALLKQRADGIYAALDIFENTDSKGVITYRLLHCLQK